MRPSGAGFSVCARVLMTSLAANNILPLRIGDIMRVFTYAGDLGASPSAILSTVILEKFLDVFVVGLIFISTMGRDLPDKIRHAAACRRRHLRHRTVCAHVRSSPSPGASSQALRRPACQPSSSTSSSIGFFSRSIPFASSASAVTGLALVLQSFVIWFCEGMIFVSAIHLIGLVTDALGPWQAVSFANLSYLLPSSPGAIGPFEWAVKTSLVSHGAPQAASAVFGLAIHAWMLISVTGAGGVIFLIHRIPHPQPHAAARRDRRAPRRLHNRRGQRIVSLQARLA